MRAIFALALVLSACVPAEHQIPLPADVGLSHSLPQAREPLHPIEQPWRAESIDPEVLGVLFAIHQWEIEWATLAQDNALDERVQKLADGQVARHSEALDREVRIAQSLDMTSWDTAISNRLRENGARHLDRLKKLRGGNFDRQYLTITIEIHREFLRILDTKLIPNVGSRELERSLQTDREDCAAHLAEARAVQRAIY